jgi:hypothetical protein
MTEEVIVAGQEPEVKQEEVKVDPYVQKATEMGWRPQEDWEGDPEDFIDAKEYVRRKPLFEKIEHQSKKIKQVEQALQALMKHHDRVKETEYNRALKTLTDAKRQALRDGETEQALMLEDKIDEIKEQKAEYDQSLQQTNVPVEKVNPAFVEWKQENSWYQKDRAMTAFADKLGVELAQEGHSPDEVLRRVSREVKEEFKHKFTNPKREGPSAVEGGSRKATKSLGDDTGGMPEEDVRMMNKIVRSGIMTKEQYLKEYKGL